MGAGGSDTKQPHTPNQPAEGFISPSAKGQARVADTKVTFAHRIDIKIFQLRKSENGMNS